MSFPGFDNKDFEALEVPGLDPRMIAIMSTVRPKLTVLGETISPYLSAELGQPFYPHVARHARRTVNPPDDTWVAFSANSRGYKPYPHFQVGLWADHLYIQFAIIYESKHKAVFASNLSTHIKEVQQNIPANFRWSLDHTIPYGTPHHEMKEENFLDYSKQLVEVKKSELTCGIDINIATVITMTGEQLIRKIEATFETLIPLYKISH